MKEFNINALFYGTPKKFLLILKIEYFFLIIQKLVVLLIKTYKLRDNVFRKSSIRFFEKINY